MSTLRAIIAAPNYWTSPLQVGTHHIARALVRSGWHVAYLSDPLSLFHVARAGRQDVRDRWHLFRGEADGDTDGRLHAWVPLTVVSPRTPIVEAAAGFAGGWLHRGRRSVTRWLSRHGFLEPDLLWVDSVVWDRLPTLVTARRSVLRIADLGAGFPRHRVAFDAMESRLARDVDLVVYTADGLRDHATQLGPRAVMQMPNGVDLSRFEGPFDEPADLTHIPHPRAIYLGAIDEWFDFQLVGDLAQRLPAVSFVLVGPDGLARGRLPNLPNVHLMGRRDSSVVPSYLTHADVGIIPFDAKGYPDLVATIQPLKLYEYLASGLPVVAARWPEIERLASPAALYDAPAEAVEAIRGATSRPNDRAAALAWVRGADWTARLDPVLHALGLPGIGRSQA